MPEVKQLDQPTKPQVQAAPAETAVTLPNIKAQIEKLRLTLEQEFTGSPALAFVKQNLRQAITGLEQEMRNILIDAQMAEAEAKRKAKLL